MMLTTNLILNEIRNIEGGGGGIANLNIESLFSTIMNRISVLHVVMSQNSPPKHRCILLIFNGYFMILLLYDVYC